MAPAWTRCSSPRAQGHQTDVPDPAHTRRVHPLTAGLLVALLGVGAFAGGVAVQKSHDSGTTAAASTGLAALAVVVTVVGFNDSLKVAVTVVAALTPVAPLAGAVAMTVGGVVSEGANTTSTQ